METGDLLPFMRLALAQADRVRGRTAPRPPVGAVIARGERVLGAGATQPPGGAHAEVMALAAAGEEARGADLYVTLEPCAHHGTTPPCVDAIIAAGIARVYAAALDPNPLVSGRGIARLRAAGIEVFLGNGEALARQQLLPFFKHILTGQPYLIAKWAMTLDGQVATSSGDARWISGPEARAWVHDLRDTVDAIIVGAGTARQDNPALTVRLPPDHPGLRRSPRAAPPLRVLIAGQTPLPETLQVFAPEMAAQTLLITTAEQPPPWLDRLVSRGVQVAQVKAGPNRRPDLAAALTLLGQRGIMAALLEGGPGLMAAAFAGSMVDEVVAFIAPCLLGGSDGLAPLAAAGVSRMGEALRLEAVEICQIGTDALLRGRLPGSRAFAFQPSGHQTWTK
jgi:diaminohydroxyphosphoribosylaminopyrimidine deaminase/5-amino-6-(5-phosphoribosylamino)uracil reductase